MEQQPTSILLSKLKPLDPDTSEHDQQKYERKVALIPHIEQYVASHSLFAGKEVDFEIAETGVSSLVCIIRTLEEKFVLKIPVTRNISGGEADCLKAWEDVGVPVPHVIEEGMMNNCPYILMSYIEAKRLAELPEEETVEKGIYSKLGKTLSQMHTATSKGYGKIVEHKAEHESFYDWIESGGVQDAVMYVKEQGLIDDSKHGSLDKGLEILKEYIKDDTESSYCHFDFGTGNTFDTDPITVFDPNPHINNPYIDIGRSVVLMLAKNAHENKEMFLKGYFGEEGIINRKVLQASILLNAYLKFNVWLRNGRKKSIQNVLAYLEKTKHVLE